MWFCPVALSSVTLEHILRSEQEEICFTREKLSHVRFWPWRRFALSECSIVSYCEYLCMKINCLLMSGIVRECISLVGNNPSLLLLADKCQLVRLHWCHSVSQGRASNTSTTAPCHPRIYALIASGRTSR